MSKSWPIKGIASFKSILDFQIYTFALYTPFSVINLIGVALFISIDQNSLEIWESISLLISFSFYSLLMFIYDFPGLAHLNRVSTGKIVFGYFFRSILLGTILGLGILTVLLLAMS